MENRAIYFESIVWHNDKWMVLREDITKEFHPELVSTKSDGWRIISRKKRYIPFSESMNEFVRKLTKSLKFSVIERRQAVDSYSLKPLVGFFLRKFQVKIPNDEPHVFLGKVNDQVILKNLQFDVTYLLGFHQDRYPFVEVGKEKRLTDKEFKELLRQGYRVYDSQGGNLAIYAPPKAR